MQGPGGSPASTASGYGQITDPTWRDIAPAAGIDTSQYSRAMAAPEPVQKAAAGALYAQRGAQPWSSNKKLMADLGLTPEHAQAAAPLVQVADNRLSSTAPGLEGEINDYRR